MTTLSNKECTTETCVVCDSYNDLIALLAEGLTLEDAFVDVIQDVLGEVNETTFNDAYEIGFKEGFAHALEGIKEVAQGGIDSVESIDEYCDCDGCCEGE